MDKNPFVVWILIVFVAPIVYLVLASNCSFLLDKQPAHNPEVCDTYNGVTRCAYTG